MEAVGNAIVVAHVEGAEAAVRGNENMTVD